MVGYQGDLGVSGSDKITGITYNGVALTQIGVSIQNTRYIGFYYLLNPASGSNTVTLTGSSSAVIEAYSGSYTGVNQSGQPDANTSNNNGQLPVTGGSSLTVTVTTVADNDWLIMNAFSFQDGISAGANTFNRSGVNNGIYDSNGAKTPPGSFSLAVTTAGVTNVSEIMAAFSPAGAVVASVRLFTLLGVGT